MSRNIDRMHKRLRELGAALRPHAKTAKSAPILQRMSAGQTGAIAVSTLREAEFLYHQGFTDILYAVGITPNKLAAVSRLRELGANIVICLDAVESVAMIDAWAAGSQAVFPALIEIDCDGTRAGVPPASRSAVKLLESIHASEHVRYAGVMTHAGGAYRCGSIACIEAAADAERRAVVETCAEFAARGTESPIRSVGSTPTALCAQSMAGITEVRAGCFAFQDLTTRALGICSITDIAVSVLASVIGHQRGKNWLIIDAGWSALSGSAMALSEGSHPRTFGVVCPGDGPCLTDMHVVSVDQEHGIVTNVLERALDFGKYPIGARVRILPVHASATAGGFDAYHVIADTDDVVAVWQRLRG